MVTTRLDETKQSHEREKEKEKIHPSFQLRADDGIRRGQDDEKEKSETWKSFEVH